MGSTVSVRLEGTRVLVIEHREGARARLRVALADAGADVTALGTTSITSAEFTRAQPDVVVGGFDCANGAPGIEILSRARAGTRAAFVPAIAVVESPSPGFLATAATAGYQACLREPVTSDRLICAVARLARKRVRARTGY